MKPHFKLILTAFVFCAFSSLAHAQRSKSNEQTSKIGILQQTYSGTKNHSFAEGSPAYGVEISTDRGNNYLRYFLKGRISYSTGLQNFLNLGTAFSSAYQFTTFAPELGISIYPVSRRERGLNLYLWGVGVLSYNYLEINTLPTGSNIPPKDQGYGYGYGGGLGFEIMLSGARVKSKSMIYGEVGFRDERAQLVKETAFEVGGITFSLGYGF
ncbi:MAG: hypothetical protein H7328_00200 [Bdellovibrio sp.]|nr:hypothetical protein [Bdellovibrio sp.]